MAFVCVKSSKEFFSTLRGDYCYCDANVKLFKTSDDKGDYLFTSSGNVATVSYRNNKKYTPYGVNFIVKDEMFEAFFKDITEPESLIALTGLLKEILDKSKPEAKYSPIEDGFLISLVSTDEFKVEMVKVAKHAPILITI